LTTLTDVASRLLATLASRTQHWIWHLPFTFFVAF
jgi:hypothetical protein